RAGCSSAFGTRAQCLRTTPSGPIHTVERITPWTFLPYIIFSPKAPYLVITDLSGSESSRNGSLYLAANFWCAAPPSGETPSTTAFFVWIAPHRSRKPQASFVHPGVSSRG